MFYIINSSSPFKYFNFLCIVKDIKYIINNNGTSVLNLIFCDSIKGNGQNVKKFTENFG